MVSVIQQDKQRTEDQPHMPTLMSTKFDLSTCCLDEEQKGELLSILQEYEDVFATSMNDGCTIGIEHEVITSTSTQYMLKHTVLFLLNAKQ